MKVIENRNIERCESKTLFSLSQLLFPLPGIIFANIRVVCKETVYFYKIFLSL